MSGEHSEVGRDEIKNHSISWIRGVATTCDFAALSRRRVGRGANQSGIGHFFDSNQHMKMILPSTKVEIIYLPSVVTVYEWDNPVYASVPYK